MVGDDDQLIHGWRHADPRHILCFGERHPGHARDRARPELPLPRGDPRGGGQLRAAQRAPRAQGADRDARKRRSRSRSSGWATSTRRPTGSPARSPTRWRPGTPPTEILALARTGYATEPLQYALAHHGIPHRVLGSLGLYERSEVRDALAYLTLLQNPRDAQALPASDRIPPPRRRPGHGRRGWSTWARERHGGDLIAAQRPRGRARRSAEPSGARAAGRVRRGA